MTRLNILVFSAVLLCCIGSANAADQVNIKALTLDECTSIALSQNPRILTATQRAIETRNKVAARRGVKLPQIEFRTDVLKYDWLPPNKEKILGGGTTDVYSALNLSMLLFSSGRAEANIDAAIVRFHASQQELRRTRQEVAFEVTRSYYNVLRLKAILDSNNEAVKQMEHYLAVAKEKNAIGKAPKIDVLRAEVQLADVTQAKILSMNQLDIARLELLNVMGIQDQSILVNPVSDDTPAVSFSTSDEFLQEAFKTNPDYLRCQYLTQAAQSDVNVARAEYGPNLNLVASYNGEGGRTPDVTNYYAGFALSIPIYTGGIVRARVGEAKAVEEQNKSTTDLIGQRITLAVRSAVLSTQDAANRLVAASKSVEQAQEALNIAQEKYAVGLGSTTEVIDTQVALAKARTNYARALYDGKVAIAALDLAIGRDPVPAKNAGESAGGEDKQ